jgi:hypothetical protein
MASQVVLPRLTENYGASRDPPSVQIPICTVKHFPSKPEHAVQVRGLVLFLLDVAVDAAFFCC